MEISNVHSRGHITNHNMLELVQTKRISARATSSAAITAWPIITPALGLANASFAACRFRVLNKLECLPTGVLEMALQCPFPLHPCVHLRPVLFQVLLAFLRVRFGARALSSP